ncbi:MAG: hypothetical protein V2A34_11850 [Lentisphaerota bacterium]
MNVLLIQPPDENRPVDPVGNLYGRSPSRPPPWNLLCLRSYILERTRHACSFVDCRLYLDLEPNLVEAIRNNPSPRILVVNASSTGLGQAMAVLEIAKRHFPEAKTVLCGQHPSAYPDHAAQLPRMDFALSGDPEPILRNLLDYMDIQQRLLRIPGLVIPQRGEPVQPYWVNDLRSLSLPDWQGIFWPAYQAGGGGPRALCRAEFRLSRGHTRFPSDRAFGAFYEPLRVWPFDRAATSLFKSAHAGVTDVMVADPPGFWTPERLTQWCTALLNVRNTQAWSLQMLPTHLDDDTLADLESSSCSRVEFIFPSTDPVVLEKYGCAISPAEMGAAAHYMSRFNLDVAFRFWVGGPEKTPDEESRILRTIRALGYRKYILEPFPFQFDTPLYRVYSRLNTVPQLEEWLQWSMDPWLLEKPVPLWGGKEEADALKASLEEIHSSIQHNPWRFIAGWIRKLSENSALNELDEPATTLGPASTASGTKQG